MKCKECSAKGVTSGEWCLLGYTDKNQCEGLVCGFILVGMSDYYQCKLMLIHTEEELKCILCVLCLLSLIVRVLTYMIIRFL